MASRALYEINSAVWLGEQPWVNPNKPDLADVPNEVLAHWAEIGMDSIWFLGAWKKGNATRQICCESPDLGRKFESLLPDLTEGDIIGSPFSVSSYTLDPALGDETTLRRLRKKLHAHGLRLLLDFVPNHLAVDHPWVNLHPDRFVWGSDLQLANDPFNFFEVPSQPEHILAHGRDPYFSGWTDTVQLNIFNTDTRRAMIDILLGLAEVCDGVRCDMAMLVTNRVFRNTWGDLSLIDYPEGNPPEFWKEAIGEVCERYPEFLFMAEVYWNMERELLDMGFDFTYDKTLYDCVRGADAHGVRDHLTRSAEWQHQMVHFIENHDETRGNKAFGVRQGAASAFLGALPGMRFYHEGEFEGRQIHLPIQLNRRPQEEPVEELHDFYHERLLPALNDEVMRTGEFIQVNIRQAWSGNHSHGAIVACMRRLGDERRLVVSNITGYQAQGYAEIPMDTCDCQVCQLDDLLSDTRYFRDRPQLVGNGLYLDLAPGQCHIFKLHKAPEGTCADA